MFTTKQIKYVAATQKMQSTQGAIWNWAGIIFGYK